MSDSSEPPPPEEAVGAPWPHVLTRGELDPAVEREWLHTNGAGAYAMSTVALMHTRRYHGLLVAALDPPLKRYVIVSHADTVVSVGKRDYRLATHQFPGIAPTPGYRLLESFAQDPIPRWTYRLGRSRLERRLCLVRGRNATVMSYTWRGKHPARLMMKPLFAMRPMHTAAHEHGGMIQRVNLRYREVEMQPIPELPPVAFGHSGMFMGSPDWWRRFEYPLDRDRGVAHEEDLWTPGTFEVTLEPGVPNYIVFGLGGLPPERPEHSMAEVVQRLTQLDPGPSHSPALRTLSIAAEQFRADEAERPGILAGYPWLDIGARDALISINGLYLVHGRYEPAKRVIRSLLTARRGALLTRGITEGGAASSAINADASLWLGEVAQQLCDRVGDDDTFVLEELYPALRAIFESVCAADQQVLWLAPGGFIANGGPHTAATPLTWMESRVGDRAVTPRRGLAIELQALWLRTCVVLARLARRCGDSDLAERAGLIRRSLQERFEEAFWCTETRYPYDCLATTETGEPATADASIRPNALIALAVAPELFQTWQASEILERVRERLLTPMGLRTLDPFHAEYRGDFRGLMEQRRVAYHQGTVWVYLLGFYARAALRLHPNDFELQIELRHAIEQIVAAGPLLGQVAQVASGEPPHTLGGCPAQAWSVAELLRMLKEQLDS